MANCAYCGRYYRGSDDGWNWEEPDSWDGYCSTSCNERADAETMDGYDKDDPDNPAYEDLNFGDSSRGSDSGCLGWFLLFTVVIPIMLWLFS